ncbi:MAG: putative deacylase [Myxococcota bacterium]|jgi:predicted deacylase
MAQSAELGDIFETGMSVQGRPLFGVDVGGDGPLVTVTAGLHGIEYIGVQLALAVLRRGTIPGARLVVFPVLNPDGYARTMADRGQGRVRDMRKNAQGVDLNRNFPMPWNARPSRLPFSGGASPDGPTYRGSSPLSEPESQALARWMTEHRPHASINCHSFMGSLIAARVWQREDWRGYTALCRAFRAGQAGRAAYFRLATPLFDVFTGELEDWQHHALQCWSVCVESFTLGESFRQHLWSPAPFWRFNPRHPAPIAERDADGVRAALLVASKLPRPQQRSRAQLTRDVW